MRPALPEKRHGIVHQELINLMGPVDHSLHLVPDVSTLMLCGLQGSGKTTSCGKLAQLLIQRQRKPMLVAADLQRPAAIQQLLADDGLRAQLGRNAAADARARFGLDRMVDAYLAWYEDILAKRKGQART